MEEVIRKVSPRCAQFILGFLVSKKYGEATCTSRKERLHLRYGQGVARMVSYIYRVDCKIEVDMECDTCFLFDYGI